MGDFVQGLGVLLAGILIWSSGNNREWWILDPICTFVFAFLVLLTTLTVLRDAIHVLMEGTATSAAVPSPRRKHKSSILTTLQRSCRLCYLF